jgi:hypothetical protein
MNPLPKMGRPSKSGLSIKDLGSAEYHRRVYRMKHPLLKRAMSGLSPKKLGSTSYMRELRRMKRAGLLPSYAKY